MKSDRPWRERGAALLAAMLTVTLVATLAAGALWQQWRGVEVESAERTRVQAAWILTGALDWSRLILREDGRSGGADYLSEPWAIPLQEARLSTFLAADQDHNAGDDGDAAQNTFLSGRITDQQGRLNVQNLINSGRLSPSDHQAFVKLFRLLGLPAAQLTALEQNLLASVRGADGNAPLPPLHLDQLLNLGLSPATLAPLKPFIALLPARTPVNLNTAPAEVLYACIPGLDMAGAQQLISARALNYFRTYTDAGKVLGGELASQLNADAHAASSGYFEVLGRLRLDDKVIEERSLVHRVGVDVKTLWRERGSFSVSTTFQPPT